MSKKNSNKVNNEKVNEQAQAQVQDTQANEQAQDAQTKADAAKAEAKRLMAEAKQAAANAKAAAKEAKQAAAKAKALTQRPVRKRTFKAFYENDCSTVISKSDVHYCVEKDAIDECVRQREQWLEDQVEGTLNPVLVYSCSKENDEDRVLICTVRVDKETNQIVIE